MISVDFREKINKREQTELVSLINRFGGKFNPRIQAEKGDLPFGDMAFDGFDTKGPISVGVERKRLHDMLACIDDNRYAAHQRIGMNNLFNETWLVIEGIWRPHDPEGWLMEGDNKGSWWFCRPAGRPVLYSKLRNYLFSVERAGTPVIHTRDMSHTAFDICQLYSYYQKKSHTSHISKHRLNIPAFVEKPALVRRWAEELDGVGPKKAAQAAQIFKTPQALANSEAIEWRAIDGIGPNQAAAIVAQIEGKRRRT